MLICPVCRLKLNKDDKTWFCDNKHVYDMSRFGTVNLLRSQKQNKSHGDDKGMVKARARFLDKGYYQVLVDAIMKHIPDGAQTGLDVGCGEGWYTDIIQKKTDMHIIGIDISKEAIHLGARRNQAITWVVGSAFSLPIADASVDCCWSVFAPFSEKEVMRILKPGGVFIQVIPDEAHLYELKECIYNTVRLNDHIELLHDLELKIELTVQSMIDLKDNQSILDLYAMTPYVYKTPLEFAKRLDNIERLSVRIACILRKYEKNYQ